MSISLADWRNQEILKLYMLLDISINIRILNTIIGASFSSMDEQKLSKLEEEVRYARSTCIV